MQMGECRQGGVRNKLMDFKLQGSSPVQSSPKMHLVFIHNSGTFF